MKQIGLMLIYVNIFVSLAIAQDTSKVILTFNEPMMVSTLLNKANYVVVDQDSISYGISRVGYVRGGDSIAVVYITPLLPYRKQFRISVYNLKDKAGNLIDPVHNRADFFFDGFQPGLKTSTGVIRE